MFIVGQMQRKVALGSEQIGMLEYKKGFTLPKIQYIFCHEIRLEGWEGKNYGKMGLGSRSTQRARIGIMVKNFSFAIAKAILIYHGK